MTREEKEVWEGLDDDERLDAYRDALDNLRDMEGRYRVVRAQLNAMISDTANAAGSSAPACSADGWYWASLKAFNTPPRIVEMRRGEGYECGCELSRKADEYLLLEGPLKPNDSITGGGNAVPSNGVVGILGQPARKEK
jgi:hypothetical protein